MFQKLLKKLAVVSAAFVFTFASVMGVEATLDMTPTAMASEDANGCINNGHRLQWHLKTLTAVLTTAL